MQGAGRSRQASARPMMTRPADTQPTMNARTSAGGSRPMASLLLAPDVEGLRELLAELTVAQPPIRHLVPLDPESDLERAALEDRPLGDDLLDQFRGGRELRGDLPPPEERRDDPH